MSAGAGDPPVILLGGRGPALSLARSLGRAGVAVQVLGDRLAAVRYSRYCSGFADLGNDSSVQDRWLAWLERGPREGVVLACHDDGLELIARNRAQLIEWGYLPIEADDEAMLAMLDKERSYEIARAVGVPCPRTWALRTPAEVETAAEELDFPCVLKPRHSHLFAKRFRAKVLFVHDREELREAVARAEGIEMLATEVIPGDDSRYCSYYTYLDSRGDPLLHFTKRKPRQYPPGFGLGTFHVTDWNPDVAEIGLRFLRGAGVRGIANVEFKRDARDGALKLIECNARFTAANHLVDAAGLNLGLAAYNAALGRPLPPLGDYRRGVSTVYPVDDARAFAAYRRSGALSARDWLRTVLRRHAMPTYARDDLLPSVMSGALRAGGWWRRASARRRSG